MADKKSDMRKTEKPPHTQKTGKLKKLTYLRKTEETEKTEKTAWILVLSHRVGGAEPMLVRFL